MASNNGYSRSDDRLAILILFAIPIFSVIPLTMWMSFCKAGILIVPLMASVAACCWLPALAIALSKRCHPIVEWILICIFTFLLVPAFGFIVFIVGLSLFSVLRQWL